MLIQHQIFTAILSGKYYSGLLLNKITEQEIAGEDTIFLKQKFSILNRWIIILEDYLDNNFDSNGNLVPAISVCLTQKQISDLTAKINLLIGSNTPPEGSDWLLTTGYWNDAGFWRDNAVWHDTLPIT